MAFTYALGSSDPGTLALSRVRLELGDQVEGNGVLPSGANLQDEEISFYLTLNADDISVTVASLAGVLSRQWAVVADVQVGPRKETSSQVSLRWATIAGDQATADSLDGGSSFVTTLGRVDGYTPNGA